MEEKYYYLKCVIVEEIGEVEQLVGLAKSIMEEASNPAVKLDIPLVVDAGHGDSWAQAH